MSEKVLRYQEINTQLLSFFVWYIWVRKIQRDGFFLLIYEAYTTKIKKRNEKPLILLCYIDSNTETHNINAPRKLLINTIISQERWWVFNIKTTLIYVCVCISWKLFEVILHFEYYCFFFFFFSVVHRN